MEKLFGLAWSVSNNYFFVQNEKSIEDQFRNEFEPLFNHITIKLKLILYLFFIYLQVVSFVNCSLLQWSLIQFFRETHRIFQKESICWSISARRWNRYINQLDLPYSPKSGINFKQGRIHWIITKGKPNLVKVLNSWKRLTQY